MSFSCGLCEREFPSWQARNSHQQAHKREREAKSRKRLVVKMPLRRETARSGTRAYLPISVKDALNATTNDTLVFERGNASTVQAAALRGQPYLIVYVEKRSTQAQEGIAVSVAAPAREESQTGAAAALLSNESFAEEVRKKIERRGGARV